MECFVRCVPNESEEKEDVEQKNERDEQEHLELYENLGFFFPPTDVL